MACRAVRPRRLSRAGEHDNIAEWLIRETRSTPRSGTTTGTTRCMCSARARPPAITRPMRTDATEAAARALGRLRLSGDPYPDADGLRAARRSDHLPPERLRHFVQNHDHIVNRPLGDRLAARWRPSAGRAALRADAVAEIPMPVPGRGSPAADTLPLFLRLRGRAADAVRKAARPSSAISSTPMARLEFPDPLDEAHLPLAVITDEALGAKRRRRRSPPLPSWQKPGAVSSGRSPPPPIADRSRAQRRRPARALAYEAASSSWRLNLQDSRSTIHAPSEPPGCPLGSMAQPAPGRLALGPVAAAFWSLPA